MNNCRCHLEKRGLTFGANDARCLTSCRKATFFLKYSPFKPDIIVHSTSKKVRLPFKMKRVQIRRNSL
jgi:hypothetical protein